MAAILEEPWAVDTAVLSDLGLPFRDERNDAGNEIIPGWTVDEILQQAG